MKEENKKALQRDARDIIIGVIAGIISAIITKLLGF